MSNRKEKEKEVRAKVDVQSRNAKYNLVNSNSINLSLTIKSSTLFSTETLPPSTGSPNSIRTSQKDLRKVRKGVGVFNSNHPALQITGLLGPSVFGKVVKSGKVQPNLEHPRPMSPV